MRLTERNSHPACPALRRRGAGPHAEVCVHRLSEVRRPNLDRLILNLIVAAQEHRDLPDHAPLRRAAHDHPAVQAPGRREGGPVQRQVHHDGRGAADQGDDGGHPRAHATYCHRAGLCVSQLRICERLTAGADGLTETCTLMTWYPHDRKDYPGGSAGVLLPSVRVRIVSPEGKMLPPGEVGEIWFHSPSNARGYLNNEKATKETFDDEGYVHTGAFGLDSVGDTDEDARRRGVLRHGRSTLCDGSHKGAVRLRASISFDGLMRELGSRRKGCRCAAPCRHE
jgi:hypothetical protein